MDAQPPTNMPKNAQKWIESKMPSRRLRNEDTKNWRNLIHAVICDSNMGHQGAISQTAYVKVIQIL